MLRWVGEWAQSVKRNLDLGLVQIKMRRFMFYEVKSKRVAVWKNIDLSATCLFELLIWKNENVPPPSYWY